MINRRCSDLLEIREHSDDSLEFDEVIRTQFLPVGEYIVCAKSDDPIARPARARLIWAANTAAATAALGVRTVLVGSNSELPFVVNSLAGVSAAKRRLNELYNVDPSFEVAFVNPRLVSEIDDKTFVVPQDYGQSILPRAALVHTRDPAIALACARRKINFILEYHDEDYQKRFKRWHDLFTESSRCMAIVAITDVVRDRLIEEGVPSDKILVLGSGVNRKSGLHDNEAAIGWRNQFLSGGFHNLAVYSGGMQRERGIADVLEAARDMPDTMFLFCGGHEQDISQWTPAVRNQRLSNVRFVGYVPHDVICELQQAADVLILSRAPTDRAAITSPLKFFEYLASGSPIVSACIPATSRFQSGNYAIEWYQPGVKDDLSNAIRRSLAKNDFSQAPHYENVIAGLDNSWEERQRALFRFIGKPIIKTTF